MITAAVLVVAVAAAAAWRAHRRSAVEEALGRGLQPGVPLAAATALLTRVGVAYTTAPGAGGTTVVAYGRTVGRGGAVTEQRLRFDARGRLAEQYVFDQFGGR